MRMGIPRVLTSDNGSEFKNEPETQLAQSLGIKRIFTTPYHPQVSLYFIQLHTLMRILQFVISNYTCRLIYCACFF